ncbi:MAG: hypothetical protein ACT4P7_10630 [Gemmatimonadaceae bacterium]
MPNVSRWCVLSLAVAACASEARPPGEGGDTAARRPIAWKLDAPAVWDDRVRLDEQVPVTGIYRSARFFTYTPRDTAIVPQSLLGIFVYDSATWAELSREPGPPLGDSLTSAASLVYIASFPQSNPFREGSPDYLTFDSMAVDLAMVRKAFRVVP